MPALSRSRRIPGAVTARNSRAGPAVVRRPAHQRSPLHRLPHSFFLVVMIIYSLFLQSSFMGAVCIVLTKFTHIYLYITVLINVVCQWERPPRDAFDLIAQSNDISSC